jgi:hypothetical protein
MLRRLALLVLCLLPALPASVSQVKSPSPRTVAEQTSFTATSRVADVLVFYRSLQLLSPHLRIERLCVSAEGRDVPLVILGKPVPSSPLELRGDPRLVVYLQANIHAGEVEGKEAVQMLARDLLLQPDVPPLDRMVILIAPLFNADGNEKISTQNRREQAGPAQGVGVRHNGQMLDINRDGVKAESPEMNGLIQNVLLRWDPDLVVDCHTTNGSYHDEPVTYSWGLNPNGDRDILLYLRDQLLPAVAGTLKAAHGFASIPYGEYADPRQPEKGWETFSPQARYITNYVGLRNRFSILNENYSYADFKTRVEGCYAFLQSVLEHARKNAGIIRSLVRQADRKAVLRGSAPSEKDSFAVEFELRPLKDPVTIHGYELESFKDSTGRERLRRTDRKRTLTVPALSDYVPRRQVRLPHAYVLHASAQQAVALLLRHGIVVERLAEAALLDVQSFRVRELKAATRPYQGHYAVSVRGEFFDERREFPAGTYVVTTAQPLGPLASTLLEPESDDGLVTWNFLDRFLVGQWSQSFAPFPVSRLMAPVPLIRETVR